MNDQPSPTPALDGLIAANGGPTRRGFLVAAGGLAAAGLLAACGSSSGSKASAPTSTTTAKGGGTPTTASTVPATETTNPTGSTADIAIVKFAASLEALAVGTYGAALTAATANKLGAVPPAVAQFVTTAKSQHQAQMDAWNKVLTDAGEAKVTDPPGKLASTVDDAFAKVTDVTGAAKLALMLEEIAAATYLDAVGKLQGSGLIKQAGSVQIIDMQHSAILNFVLGQYPVPDTFASPAKAAKPE